jgi:hypothetical protein
MITPQEALELAQNSKPEFKPENIVPYEIWSKIEQAAKIGNTRIETKLNHQIAESLRGMGYVVFLDYEQKYYIIDWSSTFTKP